MTLCADAQPKNNILITRDGQACIGEFGITGAFWGVWATACELGTLRYMAPERFPLKASDNLRTGGASTESDVYSLVMASFSVRFFVANRDTT